MRAIDNPQLDLAIPRRRRKGHSPTLPAPIREADKELFRKVLRETPIPTAQARERKLREIQERNDGQRKQ